MLMVIFIPLPAYSATLSLDYSIGFNGHFQLNTWTPVTVVLENRARPISGSLEVIVTSGSEYHQDVYPSTYALDVELPTNSKKRYAFTVLIKSATHELIIRLTKDDNILISKSVNLRPHFTEKSLAVIADNYVSPDILSVLPEELYPVNVPPKFLPETWYGYDGVKLLIMKAGTIRSLRERQYRELTRWIKHGGYLLTSGGLNYGAVFDQKFQHILPLSVLGHKQLLEIQSLAHFSGQPLAAIKPFLALNVRIDDANVLVEEADIPIVIQKNLGLGKIIFLSFDYNTPPFSRWDGRTLFWDKILTMRPSIAKQGLVIDDQKILDLMSAKIPAHFPGLKFALIFMGAYLVFLRIFLKKIGKPGKIRWKNSFVLLIMIILFTAIGYWVFFYPNHEQKFIYNSFGQLEVSSRNTDASLRYIIGLYSLKKSAYQLDFGKLSDPVTHVLTKRSRRKIPTPYVLHENYTGQKIVGSLNKWSHCFYKRNSKFDALIEGHAERDNRHLTISVENKMPHNIVDCLVYFKKRFVFVDEILADKQQTIKLKLSDLKKTEIFNEQEIERIIKGLNIDEASSYLKTSQKIIIEDVLHDIHDKYKLQPDTLVLIGWMQAGVIQPGFKQNLPQGENLTLINWELPVEMAL
jgi:hypothetical protein